MPRASIAVTKEALAYVQVVLKDHPEARGIKLVQKGTGCAGHLYSLELQCGAPAFEVEYWTEDSGIIIFFDPVALKDVLDGVEIYLERTELETKLRVRSLSQDRVSCGCGRSFS